MLGLGIGLTSPAVMGGKGFETEFDSASGVAAALVLDFAGVAEGQYFGNGDNTLTFADIITFTRASIATHRDNAGLIVTVASGEHRLDHDKDGNRIGLMVEQARTNKCLQSQALGTTWTVPGSNTTITDNAATAPDGTTTAEDVKHGDSAETIQQTITVTANKVHTISAFVKQGTTGSHDWVKLEWMDDSDATNGFEAWFNISTPAVGSTPAATGTGAYTAGSAKIEDYGNGWYRISAAGQIVNPQTDGRFVLINTTADNVETAEATNSVFWWGLVVEEGAFLTSYIPTTTASVPRAAEVVRCAVSDFNFNTAEGAIIVHAMVEETQQGVDARIWTLYKDGNDRITHFIQSSNGKLKQFMKSASSTQVNATFAASSITEGVFFKAAASWKLNNVSQTEDGATVATDTSATIPTGITNIAIGAPEGAGGQFLNGHIKSLIEYPADLSDADLVAGTTL